MSGRLSGKTAVLTAAGQGIGRATALAFADEGATVWATDINDALLAALSEDRAAIRTRRLDVRDSQDVEKFATELGAVDILFNCAGFVHFSPGQPHQRGADDDARARDRVAPRPESRPARNLGKLRPAVRGAWSRRQHRSGG